MTKSAFEVEKCNLRSLRVDIRSSRLYLAGISNYLISCDNPTSKYKEIRLSSSSRESFSVLLSNLYSKLDDLEGIINSRLFVLEQSDTFETMEC